MKKVNLLIIAVIVLTPICISAQELNLEKELTKLESYIVDMEIINNEVSQAPVKWQLLHILQVINGVCKKASASNPNDYNSKSNIKWRYVSTFGKIPRGTIKAPKNVNPTYDINENDIREALKMAKRSITNWSNLEKNNFYSHAVLLDLNKRKIKKFLKVHTRHHLKIVKDILKS